MKINPDGNCLFRCIAKTYYKDEKCYDAVRKEIVRILTKYRGIWEHRVELGVYSEEWIKELTRSDDGSYDNYLRHLVINKAWGDSGCLIAFQKAHPDFRYRMWIKQRRPSGEIFERYLECQI